MEEALTSQKIHMRVSNAFSLAKPLFVNDKYRFDYANSKNCMLFFFMLLNKKNKNAASFTKSFFG